jgi:hypothetical protein
MLYENMAKAELNMKRVIIVVALLAGFATTAKASQVVVAGPLSTTAISGPYNILLCMATNLSSHTQLFNWAAVNFSGSVVGGIMGEDTEPLATTTLAGPQAELCIWEINGSPENWRFTACTGQNPNIACTGGAVQGRVAPGMKFPE